MTINHHEICCTFKGLKAGRVTSLWCTGQGPVIRTLLSHADGTEKWQLDTTRYREEVSDRPTIRRLQPKILPTTLAVFTLLGNFIAVWGPGMVANLVIFIFRLWILHKFHFKQNIDIFIVIFTSRICVISIGLLSLHLFVFKITWFYFRCVKMPILSFSIWFWNNMILF